VLEIDAQLQMRRGGDAEMQRALASGSRYVMPYLILNVRRSHLVQDAVDALSVYSMDDGSRAAGSRAGLDEEEQDLQQGGMTEFKKTLKVGCLYNAMYYNACSISRQRVALTALLIYY
jgi:hypothetical protein